MSQSARHRWLLAAISSLVFFVNLGGARLWDIDEAIFSQAAAEMYERGDYVVPYFNGGLFPDKPPLMYWLMIAGYKLLGVGELAARFWSAAFGVGTVLLCYELGRRLFSPRVAFWGGLALATNLNFGIIARAATPDALLTFFTVLAILIFVRGSQRAAVDADEPNGEMAEPGWGTYALCYAAMGVGVLVKGPVAVVLPTAILGLFLLCTRGPNTLGQLPADVPGPGRWGWLRRLLDAAVRTLSPAHFVRTVWKMRPLTAVLMVLLVAGPWYVWVGLRTDWRWPAEFFGVHNFGRFLSAMDNHRGPIFYYMLVVPALFFPWSIVLGASIRELVLACGRTSRYRAGAVLVASWLAVELGFFSLASTKLPNYVIPCYPALALMTALFVERWIERPESVSRAWLWVAFGILAFAGLGIVVATPFAARMLAEPNITLGLVGLVPLAGALVAFVCLARGRVAQAAISLGATATLLAVWLFGVTVPEADRFQSTEAFVDAIERSSSGPAEVASFRYFRPSMVFYGHRPVAKLPAAGDVGEFFRTHPRDAFLYTLDEQMPTLSKLLPPDVTVLETHRRLMKSGKILLLGRAADAPAWSGAEQLTRNGERGTRKVEQTGAAPGAERR